MYVRANDRCPAGDFLGGVEKRWRNRFNGQFDILTKMGTSYPSIHERYRPLTGEGKPLWEFKEFDYRLYCHRSVENQTVLIVLLNGWVKQKKGKTNREDREIAKAKDLLEEFMAEFPGGKL